MFRSSISHAFSVLLTGATWVLARPHNIMQERQQLQRSLQNTPTCPDQIYSQRSNTVTFLHASYLQYVHHCPCCTNASRKKLYEAFKSWDTMSQTKSWSWVNSKELKIYAPWTAGRWKRQSLLGSSQFDRPQHVSTIALYPTIETHHVTSHNEEYVSKIGNDFGSWDLANFKCSVRFLLLHIPYNALQPPPSDFHMCLGHTWLSALTPRRCIEHKGLWLGDTAVHVLPPLQPRAIKLQSMSVYIYILYVYNYVHTI